MSWQNLLLLDSADTPEDDWNLPGRGLKTKQWVDLLNQVLCWNFSASHESWNRFRHNLSPSRITCNSVIVSLILGINRNFNASCLPLIDYFLLEETLECVQVRKLTLGCDVYNSKFKVLNILSESNNPPNPINECCMDRFGKIIITCSYENNAKVWQVSNGKLLYTLVGHSHFVVSCCLSADGQWVGTASLDNSAKVWQLLPHTIEVSSQPQTQLKTPLWDLVGHTNTVNKICLSGDNSLALTASWDRTARLWSLYTGLCLLIFQPHDFSVSSCAIAANGAIVVTISLDIIRIWNPLNGILLQTIHGLVRLPMPLGFFSSTGSTHGHSENINGCCLSSDGSTIVTVASDKMIKIWSLNSGAKEYQLRHTLHGHTDWINACNLTTDDTTLLTVAADRTARIWHLAEGRLLKTIKDAHATNILTSCIAGDSSRCALNIYCTCTQHILHMYSAYTTHTRTIHTLQTHTHFILFTF